MNPPGFPMPAGAINSFEEIAMLEKRRFYLTTKEAGELLGVSIRTVQLWVEGGMLDAWRTPGGHRRIPLQSIKNLLEQQRTTRGPSSVEERLRVLVIEDEPLELEAYRGRLNAWNLPMSWDTSTNGFEGLIKIGLMRPHVLITDLKMPYMDGLQMLHVLNNFPDLSHIHIIAITHMPMSEIHERGGLPKSVEVWQKPILFERLEVLLRHHVRIHQEVLSGR
jgi:excisionase family DNA binding protein